ncbi:AMP-binding protein [Amycolatopsis sp. La24]|uniref:AMP-binding protein n=1 Tax=Amycolatopsis sp. La24 TaxID=3028304 RepID=UPI0023AFFCBB|nr:AMP-binding protein [Amycolatopsis sp. La24]
MAFDVTSLYNRRADDRWNRICVSDLVERLTWSVPDATAIAGWPGAFGDPRFARLTFAELDALTSQIANALLARGLHRGDRVAMVCENSVEGYAFKLGVAKAGMVAAPINPAMAPDVVRYLIDRVQPRMCVVDADIWVAAPEQWRGAGVSPDVAVEIGGPAPEGSESFSHFVSGVSETAPDTTIHGDDIYEILFTSGTTAMPKGVMCSHAASTLAAHGFALTLTRGVPFEGAVKVASFLPMMYHVGHQIFLLAAFAAGGSAVIGRRPDPVATADCIERERSTALWGGSPAMLGALRQELDAHPRDVSSLRIAVYGWAALPPAVLAGLRAHCPQLTVTEIFGQTESIACHRFWPDQHRDLYERTEPQDNYVGAPSPLLASQIVDPEGVSLEGQEGVPGEAVYRSPVTTAGYYLDEAATREAFRDGWFHSGDSCSYGESGQRVMVDRYKDIVKSGGENVSTIRVESALHLHPGVAKAAVIGVPDERWGERVAAFVVLAEDAAVTEEELIAFARERLAGFETPKTVRFVDALPETVGGKVMKYKLRRQYASATEASGRH